MSCGAQRTAYDMQMAERYDPTREGYNAPPWPGLRTVYDKDLQNKWCPGCTFKEGYSREGYAMTYANPRYNFRTAYDNALQQAWCPSCASGPRPGPQPTPPGPTPPGPSPQPPRPSPSGPPNMRNVESYTMEKYASLLDDPDNIYSYALGGKQCM